MVRSHLVFSLLAPTAYASSSGTASQFLGNKDDFEGTSSRSLVNKDDFEGTSLRALENEDPNKVGCVDQISSQTCEKRKQKGQCVAYRFVCCSTCHSELKSAECPKGKEIITGAILCELAASKKQKTKWNKYNQTCEINGQKVHCKDEPEKHFEGGYTLERSRRLVKGRKQYVETSNSLQECVDKIRAKNDDHLYFGWGRSDNSDGRIHSKCFYYVDTNIGQYTLTKYSRMYDLYRIATCNRPPVLPNSVDGESFRQRFLAEGVTFSPIKSTKTIKAKCKADKGKSYVWKCTNAGEWAISKACEEITKCCEPPSVPGIVDRTAFDNKFSNLRANSGTYVKVPCGKPNYNGDHKWLCKPTGIWSELTRNQNPCNPIVCSDNPGSLAGSTNKWTFTLNGKPATDKFVGTIATTQCSSCLQATGGNPGYKCTASSSGRGKWVLLGGKCTQPQCDENPEQPDSVVVSDFGHYFTDVGKPIGTTVTVRCKSSGYKYGHFEWKCESHNDCGKVHWVKKRECETTAKCTIAPGRPDHVDTVAFNRAFSTPVEAGTKKKAACKPQYDGTYAWVCQPSGGWGSLDKKNPCNPIVCSDKPDSLDGSTNEWTFTLNGESPTHKFVDTIATTSCKSSYRQATNNKKLGFECTASSSGKAYWKPIGGKCEKPGCPAPLDEPHSTGDWKFTKSDRTAVGTVATKSCATNYRGDLRRTCTAPPEGQEEEAPRWVPNSDTCGSGTCEAKTCEEKLPQRPSGVDRSSFQELKNVKKGSTKYVKCANTSNREGKYVFHCLANGTVRVVNTC